MPYIMSMHVPPRLGQGEVDIDQADKDPSKYLRARLHPAAASLVITNSSEARGARGAPIWWLPVPPAAAGGRAVSWDIAGGLKGRRELGGCTEQARRGLRGHPARPNGHGPLQHPGLAKATFVVHFNKYKGVHELDAYLVASRRNGAKPAASILPCM
jgi:hypothetical protein